MSQYQRLLLIINPALRHSPAIQPCCCAGQGQRGEFTYCGVIPLVECVIAARRRRPGTRLGRVTCRTIATGSRTQAKNLRGRGIEVTTEVAWADDVQQDILDHVTEMQPDLLIKEVQHESALKRAFFTPMDWHLLRHCPVPVYLVGGSGLFCRARLWQRLTFGYRVCRQRAE